MYYILYIFRLISKKRICYLFKKLFKWNIYLTVYSFFVDLMAYIKSKYKVNF